MELVSVLWVGQMRALQLSLDGTLIRPSLAKTSRSWILGNPADILMIGGRVQRFLFGSEVFAKRDSFGGIAVFFINTACTFLRLNVWTTNCLWKYIVYNQIKCNLLLTSVLLQDIFYIFYTVKINFDQNPT